MKYSSMNTSGADTILTVSEVSAYLTDYISRDPILSDIGITGEVANYKQATSGHHYFSLRDKDSVLRCVMFKPGRGGSFLEDGKQILVHGHISFYVARGDLQMYVAAVRPYGIGALQQAFEEMKRKLDKEGLFEPTRKRMLPAFPSCIAVITSSSGAALQDILTILDRRYPIGNVIVIPATVQGKTASESIVHAFLRLNAIKEADVCILARGGGSLEDLWPFNEEIVARAIFASSVPVITGIGHEPDITISDLVADIRAPTPSAASEIATPNLRRFQMRIIQHADSLKNTIDRNLRHTRSTLNITADRLVDNPPDTDMRFRFVNDLVHRNSQAFSHISKTMILHLNRTCAKMEALEPLAVLNRGYAVVEKEDSIITDARDIADGDILNIRLAQGSILAETKSTSVYTG